MRSTSAGDLLLLILGDRADLFSDVLLDARYIPAEHREGIPGKSVI